MPSQTPTISADSDEQLLVRFHRGDRAALGILAARHEQALLGLALGLVEGRADLAKDAVQEAWLRVIRFGKTFRANSSVRTWLYRIVINRCHDLRQRPVIRTAMKNGTLKHTAIDDTQITASDFARGSTSSTNEELHAALAKLPPPKRLLLILCYHRGLTHPQAAEVLAIPVGTLKSRLNAALAELRQHMQSDSPSLAALEGLR